MKPKHQVFCPEIGRKKLLFESESKAKRYLDFNKNEIEAEHGYAPERSYYCEVCGGWHTTSMTSVPKSLSRTESIVGAHKKSLLQRSGTTKKNNNIRSKGERNAQLLIEFLNDRTEALAKGDLDIETAHKYFNDCQLALKKLHKRKGLHGVDLKIYEFENKMMKFKKNFN